jgi:pyruvate carboxylase subunit B
MTPIRFNNTVLRDGHQSLAATRMRTDQMREVAPVLDGMGFGVLETWGGATIDACLRYLGENPFERISRLKEWAPRTPQSMLLRGQNIVQYSPFPSDVVEAFVRTAAARGMDQFRVFDALNDLANTEVAICAVKAAGKHAQGALSYTVSPVHTVARFVEMGVEFERLGCDSICIKDMAGLLVPSVARELVRGLKAAVRLPVTLHSHCTAGLASASYLAAIEAGVDAVDVSIAPFANGSGQPDALLMHTLLEGSDRRPTLDTAAVLRARALLEPVYAALGDFTSPANERVDVDILRYQIPGGMLSNFLNQLKEQGMRERWDEVANEMPVVREALGWIPLVTPTSQIVGTQAMLNVKFGRWKVLSQPTMDVALGKYGRTPAPVSPDLLRMSVEKSGQAPVEGRAADRLEPRMPQLREELRAKGLPDDDETAVLYAMFPVEVTNLHRPAAPKAVPAASLASAAPSAPAQHAAPFASAGVRRYTLKIGSVQHAVSVESVG